MDRNKLMGVTIVISIITLVYSIFGRDASICGSLMGLHGAYAMAYTWFIWIVFLSALLLSIIWLIEQIFWFKNKKNYR